MESSAHYPAIEIYPDERDQTVAAARQAALSILSFLLATPPFLPGHLKSREVNRRHGILDLSPEEAEDYLVTDCFASQTHANVPAKTIQLLRELNAQVEQLPALHPSDDVGIVVNNVRFRIPEPECVAVAVDLGDKKQADHALLTLLLRLEGVQNEEESYKYDNLVPCDVVPGKWFDNLQEARNPAGKHADSDGQHEFARNRARGQSQSSVMTSTNSFHSALATSAGGSHASPYEKEAPNTVQSEAESQDEQQPQGDYFTDPADFWAGVDDDEADQGKSESHSPGKDGQGDEEPEERQRREKEEEDRYWAMYDQQDVRTADQSNDVSSFREYGDGAARGGSLASSTRGVASVLQEDDEVDAEEQEGVDYDDDVNTNTARATGGSTRSPDSVTGQSDRWTNDNEAETSTADHTATYDTEDTQSSLIAKDYAMGEGGKKPDEPVQDAHGPGKADDHDEHWNLQRHSPNPESVTGQSMFDAPPGMSLRELERHYRNQDMRQYAGTRQRLRQAIYGDEERNGSCDNIGPGMLPGIDEQTHANNVPMSSSDQGARHRQQQHEDPIEALSHAEPDVAVAEDNGDRLRTKKTTVPRSASMDTLRKLADNEMIDEGAAKQTLSGQKDESNTSGSGGSRAGGFKNFLQMAPSVASMESEAAFEGSTTGISMIRLPDTVEEDDEADKLSTKTQHSDRSIVPPTSARRKHLAFADEGRPDHPSRQASQRHGADSNALESDLTRSSNSRPSNGLRGLDDLDASMFPGLRTGYAHALDSPQANEDEDPLMQQVSNSINTKRWGSKIAHSPGTSIEASETFLPGASSNASMVALRSSVGEDMRPTSLRTGAPGPASDKSVDVNSTSTDYGNGLAGDRDRRLGIPDGAHNSKRMTVERNSATLELMHEHLRRQRQQALQMQRERVQRQREQRGVTTRDHEDELDDGHGSVNADEHGQPLPLVHAAEESANIAASDRPDAVRTKTSSTIKTRRDGASQHPPLQRSLTADVLHRRTEHQQDDMYDKSQGTDFPEEEDEGLLGEDDEVLRPLSPDRQNNVSVSPAIATAGGRTNSTPADELTSGRIGRAYAANDSHDILQTPSRRLQHLAAEEDDENYDRRPKGKGPDRQSQQLASEVQINAQKARADATLHAKRRREYTHGMQRRNEAVKMVLKGAWRLLEETAAAAEGSNSLDGVERLSENEFLRLAREAVRECIAEKRGSFT